MGKSPAELYVEGVKEKLGHYYAAWLPNETLALGDFGYLEDKVFRRVGNLSDFDVAFDVREDADSTPIDIQSGEGVSWAIKASGETSAALPNIPPAKAGLKLSFGHKGAFVVSMPACYEPSIANILALRRPLVRAYGEGHWDEDYVVIVKIANAPEASILVSNSSESEIELEAQADISNPAIDLGKAEIGFSMKSQKGDIVKMVGATNVSPFFQLAQLKVSWLGNSEIKLKSLIGGPAPIKPSRAGLTPKWVRENMDEAVETFGLDVV